MYTRRKFFGAVGRAAVAHNIIATPIKHDEFASIRASPSVYTTREELDRFGDAMEFAVKIGVPTT